MNPDDVASLLATYLREISEARDEATLETLKRNQLGKKSPLKLALKELGKLDPDARKASAAAINAATAEIESATARAESAIKKAALDKRLAEEWVDTTMPGTLGRRGLRHPVTEVEARCLEVLRRLGFTMVEGPEVETPFYNFDALNIPAHHPARDMQDTFYLDGDLLLRSHTTTVQARILEKHPALPIKVASAGRVYRNEAVDATHLAMFHQLEGFWVDRGITFAHLKGVLAFVAEALYGARKIRFKPKFYPYTEPSIGMDLACASCEGSGCDACHHAGWVTIMGAGMVHSKILRQFGYDPAEVGGIAFGWGTTRMTSQWVGLSRVKSLYEQDLRLFHGLQGRGV